jgi:hypothetical protein
VTDSLIYPANPCVLQFQSQVEVKLRKKYEYLERQMAPMLESQRQQMIIAQRRIDGAIAYRTLHMMVDEEILFSPSFWYVVSVYSFVLISLNSL